MTLITPPSLKLSPDRRRSGLQEGLLAEYVERQQEEQNARKRERAMMRSGSMLESEGAAQPLKDTRKKAGSASATELAPSPTKQDQQPRSRFAQAPQQVVESPDRRRTVRMDSDDVDSSESADDAEPAPTFAPFESPPRRQAPGQQSVGLLDSIARVEAALGHFGKNSQDMRQRDDGRGPRHGAFGSAT